MSDSSDPGGSRLLEAAPPAIDLPSKPPEYFWPWVMCLLGVDYFSSLAYQPSITFEVAGRLGPLATVGVVLLTLLGAVPVYCYVAARSAQGQGSIGILERLVHGWRGKTLVLLLLGFAATDFVMLKTISLADAAVHVIGNDYGPWQDTLSDLAATSRRSASEYLSEGITNFFTEQLVVTLLLGFVGFVFWWLLRKGFNRKVMVLAVPLVVLYLVLNAVIVGGGLVYLADSPEQVARWWEQIQQGDWQTEPRDWAGTGAFSLLLLCLIFLPHLALGLSGFEMSMIVMPQVKGDPHDDPEHPPGRVRNTRKVLIVAAVIMSVYLLGSVLVTTLLIPPEEFAEGGRAANRALAYLAHGGPLADGASSLGPLFGVAFGSVYDLVTIILLCLAGSSVVTVLGVLLPRFLLRFGMELRWVHKWGLMIGVFALLNLIVTLYFRASVSDQRGAYATGVLVLMSCASLVVVLDKRTSGAGGGSLLGYSSIAAVFVAITLAVIVRTPSGLLIANGFIVAILALSVFSRAIRANEMRTVGFAFKDAQSKFLWDSLRLADFPVLVPHRPGRHERDQKEIQIRRDHQLAPDVDIVFLEVEVDDPSNFYQTLLIDIFQEQHRFVIRVTRCTSVAHAIAAIALEMSKESKPPGLHFGWSELDLLTASWSYFAFGEGNVPWKVRELIQSAEPDPQRQPRVIIG
jgi:hypothetical protein